jgi:hypothetical protein
VIKSEFARYPDLSESKVYSGLATFLYAWR